MGGKNVWTYTSNTTPQIAGIREYSPGDPLHRVHWPSTAKHGKLMVKEFDEDSHAQTWILLDAKSNKLADISEIPYTKKTPYLTLKSEKNNQYIPKSSFEYAVCIAASLAEYYIKKKISVGLTAVGKQVINIQPESGQRQLSKILNKLSIIQNEGSQDIFNIFERVKFQIPKGAKVFLISNDSKIKFDQLQKSAMLKKIKFTPIYIDDITFRELFESELKVNQKMAINHELITIHYGDDLKSKLESKIGI